MAKCKCGNPNMGFNCMCDWMIQHPGKIDFSCEWCGIYTAAKPRCRHCEES